MKLKICGIRDIETLKFVCDKGVHFAGFIMANQSPRKASEDFLYLLENFNFQETKPVFVFVNPSINEVKKIVERVDSSILQFHGDETDHFCRQFNQGFWKTIRVKDSLSYQSINDFPSADAYLFETFSPGFYGGTGKVFDWGLLENIKLDQHSILAGGINAENIKEAMSLNPWCIDINSGVESSIALKDITLINQIIDIFNNG